MLNRLFQVEYLAALLRGHRIAPPRGSMDAEHYASDFDSEGQEEEYEYDADFEVGAAPLQCALTRV
jgi:hypothetical protein